MADNILVWVVDDDESIRWVLEKGLSEHDIDVEVFESAHKVILKLESENPDLILSDIKMPGTSGIDLLDQVQDLRPEIPVIIMTLLMSLSLKDMHAYKEITLSMSKE